MVRIGTPTTWSLADLHRQLEARLEPWFPEWGDRGPLWPSDGETVRTGTPTAGSLADRTLASPGHPVPIGPVAPVPAQQLGRAQALQFFMTLDVRVQLREHHLEEVPEKGQHEVCPGCQGFLITVWGLCPGTTEHPEP